MSPINERRLEIFKNNRRGYWSLWVFLSLFFVSLFAEFIANDKPIVFSHEGKFYFPMVFTVTEADLGGVLQTEAEFHDPYVVELIEANGWMLWPPVRFSYNTIDYTYNVTLHRRMAPTGSAQIRKAPTFSRNSYTVFDSRFCSGFHSP